MRNSPLLDVAARQEGKMRRKCNGAKLCTDIMDSSRFVVTSGRRAFPTAVKVNCEVGWSVGKGECWDE